MVRPATDKAPLRITFDAALTFSAAAPTPLAAYFLAPLDERCGWPPVPAEMDPTYMLKAPSRITRAMAAPFALVAAARLAASWRRPATTVLALLWWSTLCLYATWWLLPVLGAIALAAAIAATRPVSAGANGRFSDVELWGDNVEAAQGALAKLRGIGKKMATMQGALCGIASTLERSSNALNWSDPRITALALVLIVACGSAASLLAYVAALGAALLPLRRLALAAGVAALLPPALRVPLLNALGALVQRRVRGSQEEGTVHEATSVSFFFYLPLHFTRILITI